MHLAWKRATLVHRHHLSTPNKHTHTHTHNAYQAGKRYSYSHKTQGGIFQQVSSAHQRSTVRKRGDNQSTGDRGVDPFPPWNASRGRGVCAIQSAQGRMLQPNVPMQETNGPTVAIRPQQHAAVQQCMPFRSSRNAPARHKN